MAVNSVYLISWQIGKSGVNSTEIITALIIALQSAILSVLLEWFYPIRNWKIENDLWHHPAKVYCTADYVFGCRAYRYVVCKYMGFALHCHS